MQVYDYICARVIPTQEESPKAGNAAIPGGSENASKDAGVPSVYVLRRDHLQENAAR